MLMADTYGRPTTGGVPRELYDRNLDDLHDEYARDRAAMIVDCLEMGSAPPDCHVQLVDASRPVPVTAYVVVSSGVEASSESVERHVLCTLLREPLAATVVVTVTRRGTRVEVL